MPKPVALIIGVSSGIGKSLSIALEKSFQVFAGSHSINGENVIHIDLEQTNTIDSFIIDLIEKLNENRIDLLIMNSGVSLPTSILHSTDEEIIKSFSINTINQIILVRQLIPHLNKNSKIIYINSKSGKITFPFLGIYSATKSANIAIAEALRFELSPFNIQVSSICLGNTRTGIWQNNFDQEDQIIQKNSSYRLNVKQALSLGRKKFKKAMNLEEATPLIMSILSKKELRAIYYLGKDTWTIIILKKLLPNKFYTSLIKSKYGF